MIRRHVVVHGTVQGVFFRASCQQAAARLGLSGWVRNRPDGTVEAQFEGPDSAVEQMLAWCRTGPPRAAVTRVEVSDLESVGGRGFDVR